MRKLKCILLGSLLLMVLPQAFAIGDNESYAQQVGSTGDSLEHFSDCYAC